MAFFSILFTVIRSPRFLVPFGFALGGFFLYLTVRGIDWGEVRTHLAGTAPAAVVGAVAIMLFSSFLRAYRWRLMWATERVTTWRLFTVEMAALGLNNFAPVRLMDEPAVLTMLTLRDKHPAPTVVATIVMTRVQDIIFSMVFAFAVIVFEPRIADFAGPAIYLSGILIVFFVLLLNLGRVARRVPILGRIPGLLTYEQTISEAMQRRKQVAATGALTIVYSLLLGPCAWVLAQGMGVEISIFQATIVTLGAVFFATALPGLPGAVGTFEIAVVEILALWDVPRELGIGFGLILHLVLLGPTTLFAIVVLPREGIGLMQGWKGIIQAKQQDE
ncbi:MAG: lysylphosphatidylglycerol synthase transmembrane domain-containing protein [Chloroflexi bacterium]|nr:lysylphosphatidylglycerol synthase transmembrane domain-containing protein [Chloroflexota bacterium]